MKILGISGWSGCGKTTLIVALLPRLRARGLRVSTIKHSHHDIAVHSPGKDSDRHRQAGAEEVLLVSGQRWLLWHELRDAAEPGLPELLGHLQPVDLVLVEGWKSGAYPKLEIWRPIRPEQQPRFPWDPHVIAVAGDPPPDPAAQGRPDLPALSLADPDRISDFIAAFARA